MAGEISTLTQLLHDWSRGDRAALDQLTPLVYEELRRIARGYMRRERREHSLRPTDLVHEAFVRLARQETPDYQGRAHFLAIAAQHMRQILVDHARRRGRLKRGGGVDTVTIDLAEVAAAEPAVDLLALDEALRGLTEHDARKGRIVEMYYFGGMTMEEIAAVLGLHVNSVARDLRFAKAWLRARLSGE